MLVRGSLLYDKVWILLIFFAAACASFNGFNDKWDFYTQPQHTVYPYVARFDAMVDGTAPRPYVYRQLIPGIANLADRLAPASMKAWFVDSRPGKPSRLSFLTQSPIAQDSRHSFRFLVVYLVTFGFVLLSLYAMLLFCRELDFSLVVSVLAPVVLILLLPFLMNKGGYYYDYSELAFFALAAWVALRFEWWYLIPVAALATGNKESFVLFVLALYPMLRQRHARRDTAVGVGVLSLVCFGVYFVLRSRYGMNPGGTVELHWKEQLHYFLDLRHLLFSEEKTYGMIGTSSSTLVPLVLLGWTFVHSWRRLPVVVRNHAKIAAVINVPLFLLFCAPGELRDFSLLYITLLVALATTIHAWTALDARPGKPLEQDRALQTR